MGTLVIRKVGDVTIVKMPSVIDSNSADDVGAVLLNEIKTGISKLVCDFTSNTYVSSAGLRVFMEVYNEIDEKDGKMSIYGLTEIVHEIFDITGFTEVFPIVEKEEEALMVLK